MSFVKLLLWKLFPCVRFQHWKLHFNAAKTSFCKIWAFLAPLGLVFFQFFPTMKKLTFAQFQSLRRCYSYKLVDFMKNRESSLFLKRSWPMRLTKFLCGFRKAHSTQHALFELLTLWQTSVSRGGFVGSILMDLSKRRSIIS